MKHCVGKHGKGDGTILLVDDRPTSAGLFITALRTSGFTNEVVVACDGQEALDYLFGCGEHADRDTSLMPRLVLLDLNMPRLDGLETLRRIRADERTQLLPVVMLSASNLPEDVAEAYRLGANGFIDKLSLFVSFPELVKQIANYWLVINQQAPVRARVDRSSR